MKKEMDKKTVKKIVKKVDKKMMGNEVLKAKMKKKDCKY
jgi:hypothetical protein